MGGARHLVGVPAQNPYSLTYLSPNLFLPSPLQGHRGEEGREEEEEEEEDQLDHVGP
jgi:hypothetical protein